MAADLEWLRERGLDAAIGAHLAADRPALAICGGLQLLGGDIADPHGVEGSARGLSLLPYATQFERDKRYGHRSHTFAALTGFWAPLSGAAFDGYEIRHGETRPVSRAESAPHLCTALPENMGWQHGQTLALYPHGLFEDAGVMHALFGRQTPTLEDTLNGLADFIDAHFAKRTLMSFAE